MCVRVVVFGGRGEERFGFGGAVFRVAVPGAGERDFGVGDGDGAGGGFASCGFRDLDAGGLLGLDLRPPCRVDVDSGVVWFGLPLQGAAGFGCGFGCGPEVRAGWPGLPGFGGGLALGGDGGFGLVGLGGVVLPPCADAARLAAAGEGLEGGVLLPVVGGFGVGLAGFGGGVDAAAVEFLAGGAGGQPLGFVVAFPSGAGLVAGLELVGEPGFPGGGGAGEGGVLMVAGGLVELGLAREFGGAFAVLARCGRRCRAGRLRRPGRRRGRRARAGRG